MQSCSILEYLSCSSDILAAFDGEAGVASISGKHAEELELKNLYQIVDQLMESEVFNGGLRNHKSILNLKANITRTLPEKDLKKWIINNFSKHGLS